MAQFIISLQCRRTGFNPWIGMIHQRRKWQPTPLISLGKSMDRGTSWATVHGVARVGEDLAIKPPPPYTKSFFLGYISVI